jgi:predicted secreted protein
MAEECPPDSIEQEVTVVAHCLLNPLTRVRGLSSVPFSPLGPLVQLPCPEALYLGLERWAVTKNQLDVPQFRRFCRQIIVPYADLLEMLAGQGVRLHIVGLAGSPSCGVETTSRGYTGGRVREQDHEHVSGQGLFMEELMAELERRSVAFSADEALRKESACGHLDPGPSRPTNTVK